MYEMIVQSKFKKETQTEFETFHMAPTMISKFYMEEQISKVYTLNMLRKFQNELEATMYIHVTSFKNDGSVYTYEIKECSYTRDSKRSDSKNYQVTLHSDEVVQCICGFFNFQGILCRHALAVFKFRDTVEIPSHYILDRWKKDFKRLRDMDHSGNEALVSDLQECFDYISKRLGDVGFISKDRYHLSLKLIKELERSLFDDISGRDRQQIHLGFSEDNTNSNSNLKAVKRRGRPPKKGRVSHVEPLVQTNKEQDCHRSALIANNDNVSRAAPTDCNLDTYIGQGGINVVEDYDLDNLSFASYFDFNVDLQHHMSNQPGLQPNSLLQGQYDQQTMEGQNEFPWIYHDIIQEDQIEEVLSIRRIVEEG